MQTARSKESTWGKAASLLRGQCASCDQQSGECLPLDCQCVQLNSRLSFNAGRIMCKYFRDCVLPQDKALHAQLTGGEDLKPCAVCGKHFLPTNNRAQYCEACRDKQRKRSEAARLRKMRAERKQKGDSVRI